MIWKPYSVEQEPIVEIGRACIYQTKDDHFHLVGEESGGSGRVSSPITSVYEKIDTITYEILGRTINAPITYFETSSGRTYRVIGELDGYSNNGQYVLSQWLQINEMKFEELTDIDFDYLVLHFRGFYPDRLKGRYQAD